MKLRAYLLSFLLAGLAGPPAAFSEPLVLRVKKLYVGDGSVRENAVVVIEKGTIKQVASEPFNVPQGVTVLTAQAAMPGIVDAFSTAGVPTPRNEESREVTPAVRAADVYDPADHQVYKALTRGVTVAHIEVGQRNVIGGLCGLVRTFRPTRAAAVLRRAASLKATLGREPTRGNRSFDWRAPRDIFFRRPTTRMAVHQLFRDALRRGKEALGKASPSPQEAVLAEVLRGTLPLRVHAGRILDVQVALREREKYGFRLVLEHGWEAWKAAEQLAALKIPVVMTPDAVGMRMNDPEPRLRLTCASALSSRGVPLAFGTGDVDVDLRLVAATAVRYGLSEEAALRALTSGAAQVVGLDSERGKIAPGLRADVVLLSGPPFSATTRVLHVIGDGQVVFPRKGGR